MERCSVYEALLTAGIVRSSQVSTVKIQTEIIIPEDRRKEGGEQFSFDQFIRIPESSVIRYYCINN